MATIGMAYMHNVGLAKMVNIGLAYSFNVGMLRNTVVGMMDNTMVGKTQTTKVGEKYLLSVGGDKGSHIEMDGKTISLRVGHRWFSSRPTAPSQSRARRSTSPRRATT